MPLVVVCYKWVLDEADIRINADLSIDLSKAKGKISDYDKNAIEAAVQAAAALNGKVAGLTFGTADAKPSLKDALSRGMDEAWYINEPQASQADGAGTARVLAAAIKKMADVSLIICAEGASDTYARQTGPRIGALLDLPVVTSVGKLEISGNTLIATRVLDDCLQKVKVELPAVVAVLPEITSAPIPGLKAVLAAGKKPVTELKAQDLGVDLTPKSRVTEIKGYMMDRKNIIFNEGETAERVNNLVAALRKEGVV
ncbi:MAG: electron transfer flavoprotein beta subunit/FixA family protein [Syntrophomonadaceae bacterium]|jgi:electron transfer flavoprotein beta subunit|nr:electron transfer flavoprotein beta subunit/FixA family protein [Syntrophomonadaceae bacterium]